MLPKQNKEKNVQPKPKNIIIPKNNIIKNTLINSQVNSNSNSDTSKNKFTLHKVKYNSIPNFIDKNVGKKENLKKKINIRNYDSNYLTYKPKTSGEKNNKIINRINAEKKKDNLYNMHKLSNFIKNADLKQTIIIDNDGNNNLKLIIDENNKYTERIMHGQNYIKNNKIKDKINDDYFNCNLTSILTDEPEQKNLINNKIEDKKSMGKNLNIIMNDIKEMNNINIKKEDNSREKNNSGRDNRRLSEYSQIFKLLNENIEQFKNIINKKDTNINIEHNKQTKSNKLNILSSRDYYQKNKHTKGKETIKNSKKFYPFYSSKDYKNTRRNKTNKQKNTLAEQKKNMFKGNNNNNNNNNYNFNKKNQLIKSQNFNRNIKNSELYSFLDSFTEEDIFTNLALNHQKNTSKSFTNIFNQDEREENNNSNKNKNEIEKISTNDMSRNRCYNNEDLQLDYFGTDEQIKMGQIQIRDINPHFFCNDYINNINSNVKRKEKIDKECFIF